MIRTKLLVVADGLGGHLLRECGAVRYRTARRSWIGAAATSLRIPANYQSGSIHMAIGRHGYVGALQVEDGSWDIAAALDPGQLKHVRPGELAQRIRDESGLPRLPGLADLRWLGTPPLTRAPSTRGAHRMFLVGDAAGYIEPFTGEGMFWAMASGSAVIPYVERALATYDPAVPQSWSGHYRKMLGRRQRLCQLLTASLRRPWSARLGIAALSYAPYLAMPIVRWIHRAPAPQMTPHEAI